MVMLGMVHAGAAAADVSTTSSPAAAPVSYIRPSPSSTTMEDVLDSLLGLPPPSRSPSPGPSAQTQSHQQRAAGHQVPPPVPPSAPSPSPSLRGCSGVRPETAGSASDGWESALAGGREAEDVNVEGEDAVEAPAGWEAAYLAGANVTDPGPAADRAANLPDWDEPPTEPPPPAPPGWKGTAVVGVLAEDGADVEAEAEFGAAVLSMPLSGASRRRSESSAIEGGGRRARLGPRASSRRVSFDLSAAGGGAGGALADEPDTVACRRYGCGRTAPEAAARLRFKTCHNCAHTYCSRECRREHWDSHKRACAVQRVAGLLRRVVARVRTDTEAVSLTARRGYRAHGRGAVRLLFHSADVAEAYCAGRASLAEASQPCASSASLEMAFVRWADLPAGELGGSLHQDLTRLCNTYNPRTRAVTLVVLEVLSEAPSDDGVVMWERQLVSRVFKVHLFREATLVMVGAGNGARAVVMDNVVCALKQRGVDVEDEEHGVEWRRVKDHVLAGMDGPLSVDLLHRDGGRVVVVLVSGTDIPEVSLNSDGVEIVDLSAKASNTRRN